MKKRIKICPIVVVGLIFICLINTFCSRSKKNNSISWIPTNLPHQFKTAKGEQLSIEAFALKKAGKYDKAISLYRQAIIIESDNPRPFFDLAECLFQQDKLKEAIQAIDTAIILDTSYAGFYNNRGFYYYQLYDNQSAINNFKKAIDLDSTNYVFFANMALAYNGLNNSKEACKALDISKRLGLDLSDLNNERELIEIETFCKLEMPEVLKKNTR